jgi:transposase-like protein
MTRKHSNRTIREIKAMMAEESDFLRPMVRTVIQEFLEAEMAEAVGAEKGERVEGRLSCRSGYHSRSLITRVGKPHRRRGTSSASSDAFLRASSAFFRSVMSRATLRTPTT